jgi:hypothetical protein
MELLSSTFGFFKALACSGPRAYFTAPPPPCSRRTEKKTQKRTGCRQGAVSRGTRVACAAHSNTNTHKTIFFSHPATALCPRLPRPLRDRTPFRKPAAVVFSPLHPLPLFTFCAFAVAPKPPLYYCDILLTFVDLLQPLSRSLLSLSPSLLSLHTMHPPLSLTHSTPTSVPTSPLLTRPLSTLPNRLFPILPRTMPCLIYVLFALQKSLRARAFRMCARARPSSVALCKHSPVARGVFLL